MNYLTVGANSSSLFRYPIEEKKSPVKIPTKTQDKVKKIANPEERSFIGSFLTKINNSIDNTKKKLINVKVRVKSTETSFFQIFSSRKKTVPSISNSENFNNQNDAIPKHYFIKSLELDEKHSLFYHPQNKEYIYLAPAPPITNLVISGGGAKGVSLPGVFKAFEEHRTGETNTFRDQLTNIAGSSVGALYGGLLAAGLSADQISEITTKVDFQLLLGKKKKKLTKTRDGQPLLELMQAGIYQGVTENLCKIFKAKELGNIGEEALNGQPKIKEVIDLLMGSQKVTFGMLKTLHEVYPHIFKLLTVTGTCIETDRTFYFNAEDTPNLDIALACRASASLPIILEAVKINQADLSGGVYVEEIKDYTELTFIDGGYYDNIPVKTMEKLSTPLHRGEAGQNLQTLALVFESKKVKNKSWQSDFLNVLVDENHLYRPNFLEKLIRNTLVKYVLKLKSSRTNTRAKSEGLNEIPKNYTQRNIPLNSPLKTSDFKKANKLKEIYQKKSFEQTVFYLQTHQDELIARNSQNLDDLLQYIPSDIKETQKEKIEKFR